MLLLVDIAEEIAKQRKAAGLSRAELAKRALVSRSTLEALENGRIGELGYAKVNKILTVLGLEFKLQEMNHSRPTLDELMIENDREPKRITESKGYKTCTLELEDQNGQLHQLERSLTGDFFTHRIIGPGAVVLSEEFLSEKNDPANDKTISGFLLVLMGAWGLKIRQSKAGKTRQVGFSDFRRVTIVNEVRIIGEGSPALSGQYASVPEEISFLKLLLTGDDDSSVVATETSKQSAAKRVIDKGRVAKSQRPFGG